MTLVRLAIDTVTDQGSVALQVSGDVVAERTFADRRHAAVLLPSIMECLDAARLELGQIGEILIADGPGSFTGIRIGFATVAGLVAAAAARVFVAPSMMSSAAACLAGTDGSVVALYDALRGEVYAAWYRMEDSVVHTIRPPHVTTVPALIDAGDEAPCCVVGDGASAFSSDVVRWTGRQPSSVPVHARNLFLLRRMTGGLREVSDLSMFEPDYGRKAEAQVRWERRHGRRLPDSIGTA